MNMDNINEFIDNILSNIEKIKLQVKELEVKDCKVKELTKDDILADVKLFENCSDELKNDKYFVCQVLEKDASMFRFMGENLKKQYIVDKSVMMSFIKRDGMFLEFCTEELRDDMDLIIIAIFKNNEAKKFVKPELLEILKSIFE